MGRPWFPGRLLGAVGLVGVLLMGLRWWPQASLREQVGSSTPVYDRHGTLMRLTLASDQQYRLWTPLAEISPAVVETTLLYEDRLFWWHPGVDPSALARSAWQMASGGRRQGGSTLTMQLARRVYGIDSSSMAGKLQQILAAVWLEARYSKRDLLEAYLNTAPYGSNIEGVGAASLIYFHHDVNSLSVPEALTLSVIPQNPGQRVAFRSTKGGGGNADLESARRRLWELWRERHPGPENEHLPRMPVLSKGQLPFAAPHVSDMLLVQAGKASADDTSVREADGSIHATIDLPMQRTLERVMAEYLKTRANIGLRNASALLLDASTMEVRAVVGSANYWNDEIAGQVNGTLAKRSPGSTLKPFIYALALDQGLLHPRTLLKDAPTSFGPFTPENFDGQFMGPVPAQDALIRSRNIPAVSVAARLSQPNLYQFLRLAQISRLQSEEHYGLALVLGGGEVTPEELARLYALLANGGQLRELSYTRGESLAQAAQTLGPPLISPEAAYVTLDMLRQSPRPDTGSPARPSIAWKTGTSWGFRDAWTAGVFGRMVLVVWVGNFDGEGNPAFIGIDAAAPLYVRMVDALRAQRLDPGEVPKPLPANLRRVEVCATTGALPDPLCPARTTTWFIAGKSPIQTSQLNRAVWVDDRSGKLLCGPQAASSPHARRIVIEQWSSDMLRVFKQSGLPRRRIDANGCDAQAQQQIEELHRLQQQVEQGPQGGDSAESLDPAETANQRQARRTNRGAASPEDMAMQQLHPNGDAPMISSPLRGVRYVINPLKPQTIALRADAAMGVKTLYWFANDSLVGKTGPGEGLAWAPPRQGSYTLRVVDDQGRVDMRLLTVDSQ